MSDEVRLALISARIEVLVLFKPSLIPGCFSNLFLRTIGIKLTTTAHPVASPLSN